MLFPLMTAISLKKFKSRNKVSVGEPAEGSFALIWSLQIFFCSFSRTSADGACSEEMAFFASPGHGKPKCICRGPNEAMDSKIIKHMSYIMYIYIYMYT